MKNLVVEIQPFPKKYKTMQQRFLYVVIARYGSKARFARLMKFTRQFVTEILLKGDIPLEYASYLADKFNLPTGLFKYADYVQMKGKKALEYEILIKQNSDWFDDMELDYVVSGNSMPSPLILLESIWKKFKGKK